MSPWTLGWLVVLGVLVGVLVAARPVPVAAAVAGALGVGWLLDGHGFWGYAGAAVAALALAEFCERAERALRVAWRSSG